MGYDYPAGSFGGLSSIIEQGGDADINGAVIGALLGLKFGYSNIPDNLKLGLIGKDILEAKTESLVNLISLSEY